MWFLVQPFIATNAHWHWAQNGYLAFGIARAIAFALTALFSAEATAQETMTSKERSAPSDGSGRGATTDRGPLRKAGATSAST